MPTHGDETLHERYRREHADHLARLAKMTPEQIAEMELSLHNALCEIERLKNPQMCLEARKADEADEAEAVKLQRLLMADYRSFRPKGEGLMGWAAAALQTQPGGVATHLGWDFLDDGTKVATYFVRVAGEVAPKLYTHPVAAPVSRTAVELLNLAEHLLNSEVFNNDGSVRSVTQEERDELRTRIEKHLGNTLSHGGRETFQRRVQPWLMECFGATIAGDKVERNHRFLEEAIELVQACGCTADESHKLVDYVYGRPVGEKAQEVGGVMVTLAALCLAQGLDMHKAGEIELSRITDPATVERIREKQKRKPAMSPLPGSYPERVALSDSLKEE